jgi:MarR family transcriptional regulator, 2-MHQ and catechol-resistance regulon repressor
MTMKPKIPTTDHQRAVLKVYTQMMRAIDAVTTRMHRHLTDTGLTLSQFGVLEALYNKGPLCQRDIGRKILKTSGNMTTVIDNLEKRKLVVREKDLADRRRISVKLTEKGYELIAALFPIHAGVAEKTFAVMDAGELATFSDLLRKVGKANTGPVVTGSRSAS